VHEPHLRGAILLNRLPTDGLLALDHSRLCQIPMPFAGFVKKSPIKKRITPDPWGWPVSAAIAV
jgi:hypothetical protein